MLGARTTGFNFLSFRFKIETEVGADYIPTNHSLIPPIGHATYFGDYLAIQLALAAYLVVTERRRSRLLYIFCSLLLFAGVWISATRTSLLCLIVMLFSILITFRKSLSFLKTGSVVVLSSIVVFVISHLGHWNLRMQQGMW